MNSILHIAKKGATSFWQDFEVRSQLVQGDLTKKLLHHFPNLTPGELRLILLLRSGLSNKEIASMLSTEVRRVESRRAAIRKKLTIPRSENLITYLNSF